MKLGLSLRKEVPTTSSVGRRWGPGCGLGCDASPPNELWWFQPRRGVCKPPLSGADSHLLPGAGRPLRCGFAQLRHSVEPGFKVVQSQSAQGHQTSGLGDLRRALEADDLLPLRADGDHPERSPGQLF